MLAQVAVVDEALLAVETLEWPVGLMHGQVVLQIAHLRELGAAVSALADKELCSAVSGLT